MHAKIIILVVMKYSVYLEKEFSVAIMYLNGQRTAGGRKDKLVQLIIKMVAVVRYLVLVPASQSFTTPCVRTVSACHPLSPSAVFTKQNKHITITRYLQGFTISTIVTILLFLLFLLSI